MSQILNTDLLKEIVVFQSDSASEFALKMSELKKSNYEITNTVLDSNGIYKLIAKLKPANLVKCLLKKKEIPEKDQVYPSRTTNPELCSFYIQGICICSNHNSCLYQDTKSHREILNKMVVIYNDDDVKDYHNNYSLNYEDTELGRILSIDYQHINVRKGMKNEELIPRLHY